ncbi:MAG TPA: DMT family transporter [Thermoplasmata archaeon]
MEGRGPRWDLFLLLALGAIWGSAFVVIRASILAGATPFLSAELRFLLAAGIMAVVAWGAGQPRPAWKAVGPSVVIGGVMMMGSYTVLVYWGEQSTPGGLSSVFVATVPLWSALFAFILLPTERVGWVGVVGVLAGFLGVVALFLPDLIDVGASGLAGPVAIVGAALLFSIGSVVLRRLRRGQEGFWSISVQFAICALVILPFALWDLPSEAFPVNALTVGSLLYLAALSSVLGIALYYTLHHRVGPSRANIVTYVSPAVGLALGIALLGETLVPLEVAGFALILAGVALLHKDRLRREATLELTPPRDPPRPEARPPTDALA